MGSTASRCTIINQAIHDIGVEIFGANDAEGNFLKHQYALLPGQSTSFEAKKGAYVRLSGDGRRESLQKVFPDQVINVKNIKKEAAKPAVLQTASPIEKTKEKAPQKVKEPLSQPSLREDSPRIEQAAQNWLDGTHSGGKDELQQLVHRLDIEALQQRRKGNGIDSIPAIRAS